MNNFDIIIVCYKDDERLYQTLKSIENCNFKGNIFIQDGYLESEISYLDEFDLNIFYNQSADKGLYDAMNLCANRVKNVYFLTINCGDLLCSEYKNIYPYLQSDFDLVCTSVLLKSESGNVYPYPASCVDINERMSACHQGIFIKRDYFISNGGYDCKYKICADFDFLNRSISSECNIAFINNIKTCIFESFGGLSDKRRFALEFETALIRNKRKKNIFIYLIHLARYLKFKMRVKN